MRKIILFLILGNCATVANAQFAPPAGQPGSTAIYKDSSFIVSWASGCTIIRGYQDISNPSLGYASYGDSTMALGKAGENGLVSLGDGGSAILTFTNPIKNGSGWDFAVFENSFSDTFLELAFVEVSSDGINYFRFPATSNTQDTSQVDGFGIVDATKINNLAGKYRALYGTPFDLQELTGQSGLDVNNITHIKIIDVVGCIQNAYACYDQYGHKINDPWNTPFASSGFDLDAVGVINQVTGINELFAAKAKLSVFPNPVKDKAVIQFFLDKSSDVIIEIIDITGKSVYMEKKSNYIQGWQTVEISGINANNGLYFLKLETQNGIAVQKIIISNE
ncbi:MAG: T9SS type A sorting domain-containing protein [Bacteroidales bacterium]|nr:T9SS type A sorting domain-containing protein [Bacteroidales bacterium]